MPMPEKLHLEDKPSKGYPKGKYTGDYDTGLLSDIIKAAYLTKVDPKTAMAIAMAETHWGNYKEGQYKGNPMRVNMTQHPIKDPTFWKVLLNAMNFVKEGTDKYGETIKGYQHYSGIPQIPKNKEGKPKGGMMYGQYFEKGSSPEGQQRYFGKLISNLTGLEQGERVANLKEVIGKIPGISDIIQEAINDIYIPEYHRSLSDYLEMIREPEPEPYGLGRLGDILYSM